MSAHNIRGACSASVPKRFNLTDESAKKRFEPRSFLLGFFIAIFALTPALSGIVGIENATLYVASFLAIFILSGMGILGGFRSNLKFHWGVFALLIFGLLIFLRLPSFSEVAWVAFSSVLLSLAIFLFAQAGREADLVWGVLLGLAVVATVVAVDTTVNPNYAFARNFGYNQGDEAYLISSPTIAALIGPAVLAARFVRQRIRKFMLFLFAAFLFYALFNSLGRAALLSGSAAFLLALMFTPGTAGRAKFAGFLRGAVLLLPILPVGLTLLAGNQYLWWRMVRMLDVEGELAVGGRGPVWDATFRFIAERPLLGAGVGGIQNYLGGDHPHNALLEAWADLGIFGFLAILTFLIAFALSLWKTMVRGSSVLSLAIHLAAFVFIIESLKSGSIYLARPMMILGPLALGFLHNLHGDRQRKNSY